MINPFFENKGPIKINDILNSANIKNKFNYTDTKIFDVKDLVASSNNLQNKSSSPSKVVSKISVGIDDKPIPLISHAKCSIARLVSTHSCDTS